MTLVVAVAGVLLAVRALPEGKSRRVAWSDLSAEVGPLTIVRSQRRLFRDPSKLERFLQQTQAQRPAPRVDFATRQLLLVSPGPRSSTGYQVGVLSVSEHDGKITVRVHERTPRLHDQVKAHVTYPYRLISLPAGPDVYVDWLGR